MAEANPIARTNGRRGREGGVALVTGAGRGIGAGVAEVLAADGWPVAVNYRADEDGARGVVERVTAAGGRAAAFQADVGRADEVDAMFDAVEEQLGPVLALVNNAGIRHDRLAGGLGHEEWQRVLDTNLSGTFHTIHRAVGGMIRRRYGRIVNVSTISAARPLPGQAAYAASKAGIEALTRTVAIEVGRRGVTVNAISPGLVATDFVPEMTDDWAQDVPVKRSSTPEEIGGIVRFLASDEAAYITGTVIPVDGGLTAGLGLFARSAVGQRDMAVNK
jgi:3-oxoacyl-[acyl-carrier protein] reductase